MISLKQKKRNKKAGGNNVYKKIDERVINSGLLARIKLDA